ncbi:MAG: ABC transporter permease [Oscillospiraceae bacterium]|nr:ABC transporter permease [Oscillospiraceae bacterium]
MKRLNTQFKSLYRSPLKTAVTLLLLAAAAFLFLYNLGEYAVSDREYREACDRYQGVLTVEERILPDNATIFDYFLMTDETGRTDKYGAAYGGIAATYENAHQKSLGTELIEKLSELPYVSRVDKRYLTAGVSPEYTRLDMDKHFFPYNARVILTATVTYRFPSHFADLPEQMNRLIPEFEPMEYLILEDMDLLAGDPDWLIDPVRNRQREQCSVFLQIVKEEYRGLVKDVSNQDYTQIRANMFATENHLYLTDLESLQQGRRYVLVLRNNRFDQFCGPSDDYVGYVPDGLFHQFDMGDDSLLGWWPYFVDITDLPENWLETDEFADLRELIRVTNEDIHTFDVVYGDDMAAQRRVAEGRMACDEGRLIGPEDAGQPVCVVNVDLLETYGLKVGDSITLDLGNYLSEQYAPLGAVAVTRGRQNSVYTEQTFTIIGSWRDLNEGNHVFRDRFWCWSDNAIFVPSAFLPECRNAVDHEFKPSEVSFIVDDAEKIIPFMEECLPLLEGMGIEYVFSDGGWSSVGQDLMQARTIALVKLLVFGGAAVFALVLTIWLFIGRKKREYAIYRALGMPKREASMQLYMPFLMLGGVSAVIGAVAARVFSLRQLAKAQAEALDETAIHTPAGPALYILGTVCFLAVLAAFAWGGILLIRRRSILELLRADGGRREKIIQEPENVDVPEPGAEHILRNLGGSRSKNWGWRYLRRLLGRNLGRSALSLVLAALLAFAFGLVTVLRGIYAEAYQNVEVKPVISGGLSYERAVKIAESGYVRDPYYEYVAQDGMIEMEPSVVILTNRLDRRVTEPVAWLTGWDEEKALHTDEKVLVMYASHAKALGVSLGDNVRLNEMNWWNNVTALGLDPLKPGETDMERRDARRPFFQVVGIIQSNTDNRTVFLSTDAQWKVRFLVPKLELDIAEYTLTDYHQTAAFSDYVKDQLDKNQTAVKLTMDTSYADRIYQIHRLIESLYPLVVAAALLLGGVLPGLIVLHSSKEISILRALGVRVKDCIILYTLSQVLCALSGLVLGIAMMLVVLHPELSSVIVPFAVYVAAHLAACAVGSGVFAWICAQKHVLAQLQAKE